MRSWELTVAVFWPSSTEPTPYRMVAWVGLVPIQTSETDW